MSMIVVEHLRKEYPNVTPLNDICTEINKGEVISIIGPSGTGKSTFLRCLNQLEHPTSGKIYVNGEDITSEKCDITKVRQKMGMVFQSFNLFANLSVIDNVIAAPVNVLKMPREEAVEKAKVLLQRVGMLEKAQNFPDELSGGQKQRVAIARAIAMDPEIILFDEPTSALDPTMVGEELTSATLIQHPGTLPIHFEVEYSNVDESARVTVAYAGEAYNPLEDEDSLSAAIVNKICASSKYVHNEENKIELDII